MGVLFRYLSIQKYNTAIHFKSFNLNIEAGDPRKLLQTFQRDLLYIFTDN